MISNLNGLGSVRVHQKERFSSVRGSDSGSVRLPGYNRLLATFAEKNNFIFSFLPNISQF